MGVPAWKIGRILLMGRVEDRCPYLMMGWGVPIFLRKRSFCGCYNFLTLELEDLDMNRRVGYVAITIGLLALAGAGCSSPGLLTGDDGTQTTLLATATPTLAAATDSP